MDEEKIMKKLNHMEKDLHSIKTILSDAILDVDDYKALVDYKKQKSNGSLIPEEHLEE